ncbi:hypothetical protein TYRP_023627 [Tyrophagus putrescentiae]|nr:hypothetical protein TYRP_023627 [Tyrophagus putrescentiae]
MKSHLNAHLATIEARKNKTVAIIGQSVISLTQMPLDILEFYHRIACGKISKPKANETSRITPLVKDLSLVVKPLPTSPTVWTEIAMVKCMPSAYIRIAHFENERMKVLSLNHNIRNLISQEDKNSSTNIARNYLIFLKIATNSLYDFADALLYTGFTRNKMVDQRITGYFKDVQQIINGKQTLDQFTGDKHRNQEMYAKMLECWKAGSDCFTQYLSENRWTTCKEALFNERAMIAAFKWLPANCNRNHGQTANHSEVVVKNGITEEQITEIGIAEMVTHFNRNKVDMQFAKPMKFSSVDQFTRTPSPTPESLLSSGALQDALVPPYSLMFKSVTDEAIKLYSYHLFMALFTLPPKDTNWFLSRMDSLQRANELDDLQFLETCCFQWAQKVWHTVFIANVIAANKQLKRKVRHPASKQTHKLNFDFICTSALLLAQVIGLKTADGTKYSDIKPFAKQVTKFLNAEQTYRVKGLPPFRKIISSHDLAHTSKCHTSKTITRSRQFDSSRSVSNRPIPRQSRIPQILSHDIYFTNIQLYRCFDKSSKFYSAF